MAEMGDAAPTRSAGKRWIGKAALGVLLIGVIVLGIWFGLGQPRFWQALIVARTNPSFETTEETTEGADGEVIASSGSTPEVADDGIAASAAPSTSLILSSTLPSIPTFEPQSTTTGNSTFTSRELVTTTLAVPLEDWPNGAAQSVALSADGRWIAFTAENASGDDDLYLFDRNEGELTLVTVALDGASSN